MPLRKTKGRRRPKPAAAQSTERVVEKREFPPPEDEQEEKKEPASDGTNNPEPSLESSMDEEEKRARETIALLAKKYQVRSEVDRDTGPLVDIIRISEEETSTFESGEKRVDQLATRDRANKEAAQERINKPTLASRERESDLTTRLRPRKQAVARREKENIHIPEVSPRSSQQRRIIPQRGPQKSAPREREKTAGFKAPKIQHNHSTPTTRTHANPELYGFEGLDSPLTLSPVASTTFHLPSHPSSSLLSPSATAKPSPFSHLRGTYDIPLKKKTPIKQLRRNKERRQSFSATDRWAQNLNAEFEAVEEFKLPVE